MILGKHKCCFLYFKTVFVFYIRALNGAFWRYLKRYLWLIPITMYTQRWPSKLIVRFMSTLIVKPIKEHQGYVYSANVKKLWLNQPPPLLHYPLRHVICAVYTQLCTVLSLLLHCCVLLNSVCLQSGRTGLSINVIVSFCWWRLQHSMI